MFCSPIDSGFSLLYDLNYNFQFVYNKLFKFHGVLVLTEVVRTRAPSRTVKNLKSFWPFDKKWQSLWLCYNAGTKWMCDTPTFHITAFAHAAEPTLHEAISSGIQINHIRLLVKFCAVFFNFSRNLLRPGGQLKLGYIYFLLCMLGTSHVSRTRSNSSGNSTHDLLYCTINVPLNIRRN